MNTSNPLSSALVVALLLFVAGHLYYDSQFSDAGMLSRARAVLTDAGSLSKCTQEGVTSFSGGSDCWDISGYRLAKDADGLFRIYNIADSSVLGGVRKGSTLEVFVDRSRLEKAVEILEQIKL